MPLRPLPLPTTDAPPPAEVERLLAAAGARVQAWFDRPGTVPGAGFVPSDARQVYAALAALRRLEPGGRRFCEWGSGFGTVALLAAQLGWQAFGIERDPALVAAALARAAASDLPATFVCGSFVPADWAAAERWSDLDTRTVLGEADAYDELELDVDDFDVVFVYPWPGEEELHLRLFHRTADVGAVLLVYGAEEGVRAWRKLPSTGRG
jgi:SAM-dependent methyltransferase